MTQQQDELIARLMEGESVPEADDELRRTAAMLKLAISQSFENELSPEQKAADKARAYARAQQIWAGELDTIPTQPAVAAAEKPQPRQRPTTQDSAAPSWLSGLANALAALLPRPAAWAFATIAVAIIGITVGTQYREQAQDDPFQMRGGEVQTVTIAVASPETTAEQIRSALTAAGLKVRVRSDGVFHFVDIVEIPQPPGQRIEQVFNELKLPQPTSTQVEIGLRPE